MQSQWNAAPCTDDRQITVIWREKYWVEKILNFRAAEAENISDWYGGVENIYKYIKEGYLCILCPLATKKNGFI